MANKIYPANGLEIDFLGLPMIINDGQTENTLQVRLTNNNFFRSLDGTPTAIVLDQHTPVHIWFVVDVAQASAGGVRHWALTSFDAFHDARVALEAVSYTHLDVYKRQTRMTCGRRSLAI